jgi:GNAT superfamily N-acetyltransferase
MAELIIRERRDADLAACVAILAEVYRRDGYPVVWPGDPTRWLAPDGVLASWVAEVDGAVAGQVLLRDGHDLELPDTLATAAGVPTDRLASVGRLVVAPSARGRGAGAALLTRATTEAHLRALRPALDVVAANRSAAVALYERHGWHHITTTPATWTTPDGTHPTVLAYLGPPLPARPPTPARPGPG